MNRVHGFMKRIKGILLCGMSLFFVLLTGCGTVEIQDGVNLILNKDDSLTVTVREDFPSGKYSIDELNRMNESEVSVYNQQAGEDRVEIVSSETDGEKISLTMNFKSWTDYTAMNRISMFEGTAVEAVKEGYQLSGTYTEVSGEMMKKELTDSDLEDRQLIIVNDPVTIHSHNKILYATENVHVADNKKMATVTGDETAIVVFK